MVGLVLHGHRSQGRGRGSNESATQPNPRLSRTAGCRRSRPLCPRVGRAGRTGRPAFFRRSLAKGKAPTQELSKFGRHNAQLPLLLLNPNSKSKAGKLSQIRPAFLRLYFTFPQTPTLPSPNTNCPPRAVTITRKWRRKAYCAAHHEVCVRRSSPLI